MNTTTLSALAEPNRLRIVELLRDGPQPVGEIAERLVLRQPQVSKHLHVLSQAGLVEVHPAAQQRIYQLQARPFQELDTWLETFRRIWETRLDTLDEYMQELKQQKGDQAGSAQGEMY
jgi:DNA-binding transcriptional ArsR family regulator